MEDSEQMKSESRQLHNLHTYDVFNFFPESIHPCIFIGRHSFAVTRVCPSNKVQWGNWSTDKLYCYEQHSLNFCLINERF